MKFSCVHLTELFAGTIRSERVTVDHSLLVED